MEFTLSVAISIAAFIRFVSKRFISFFPFKIIQIAKKHNTNYELSLDSVYNINTIYNINNINIVNSVNSVNNINIV